MSTTDERILRTLRAQAWERAKGELQAVLQTYWDEGTEEGSTFRKRRGAIPPPDESGGLLAPLK